VRRLATLAAALLGAGALAAGTAAAARPPRASGSAAVYYRLVQYPQAGFGGLYAQIAGARHTIDMEIYELKDTTAEQDLAAAAARGVKVRVLLDRDYSGASVNAGAYSFLSSHGVAVRWAPAHYIFHIKVTAFDGRTADISTANLTSEYYGDTRDAAVLDTDPAQVQAIEQTFANDWNAAPGGTPREQTVQAPGLVWSPETDGAAAETAMVAQIRTARHSIEMETEEMSDSAIYDALAADARRGVSCKLVMTASSQWDQAFALLKRAGCQVRLIPDSSSALYLGSAGQSLLIGSQNASWDSLHEDRELSVLIHAANGGSAVLRSVANTFTSDFAQARPYV
jgi:cardiolipin synthase